MFSIRAGRQKQLYDFVVSKNGEKVTSRDMATHVFGDAGAYHGNTMRTIIQVIKKMVNRVNGCDDFDYEIKIEPRVGAEPAKYWAVKK